MVPKDNAHVQSAPIYQDEQSTASFLFAVSPAKSPDSDRISLKLQAEPRRYS